MSKTQKVLSIQSYRCACLLRILTTDQTGMQSNYSWPSWIHKERQLLNVNLTSNTCITFSSQQHELNQLVIKDCIELPFNEGSDKFNEIEEHSMLECIRLCRRLEARLIFLCRRLFKRFSTFSRWDNQDLDTNIGISLMAGLKDKKCLSKIKIMGAVLKPLYQSKSCMIDGGLCMEDQ